MASVFSGQNISHMNQKQLAAAARNIGVDPVTVYTTINQNRSDATNGKGALITAIKAK